MILRAFLAFLFAIAAVGASAEERIRRYDVVVDVEKDGDIVVTETIDVTAEGNRIQRGIFRDLPRYYMTDGGRLQYDYDVLSVERDGNKEPYARTNEGAAVRIRIGDADVYLTPGDYEYEIRYRVKNQVRYFERYDEVYWNATGTNWAFPIDEARATIVLPSGGRIVQQAAYTGRQGETGADYDYSAERDRHVFRTTRPLGDYEGLTVALGFEKGLIDPPSGADARAVWWQRNVALVALGGTLIGLFAWYWRSFNAVGRDPAKGPVFPRYAPPEGYSPAAAHHIYFRRTRGHDAFIATLMNMAVRGALNIDPESKKVTRLEPHPDRLATAGLAPEEMSLFAPLFPGGAPVTLGKKYDAGVTSAYTSFYSGLSRTFGKPYFKWNAGYAILAIIVTGGAIFYAINHVIQWSVWHTGAVILLAALNGLFLYLMPAPTKKGQEVRTEIEGFRLYLETAEKLQLNAAEVGGDAPPPMTVERYERFLPYAIALGVEKPWTKHFERLMPAEAQDYRPAWTSSRSGGRISPGSLNQSLMAGLSSGVTTALPQSSSSSGSGGGGSSGGGGGGGGGGGW